MNIPLSLQHAGTRKQYPGWQRVNQITRVRVGPAKQRARQTDASVAKAIERDRGKEPPTIWPPTRVSSGAASGQQADVAGDLSDVVVVVFLSFSWGLKVGLVVRH